MRNYLQIEAYLHIRVPTKANVVGASFPFMCRINITVDVICNYFYCYSWDFVPGLKMHR